MRSDMSRGKFNPPKDRRFDEINASTTVVSVVTATREKQKEREEGEGKVVTQNVPRDASRRGFSLGVVDRPF